LGFIVLENGLQALSRVGRRSAIERVSYPLAGCSIRDHRGNPLLEEGLSSAHGIMRAAFLEALREDLPGNWIRYGQHFSHFEYAPDGRARAAAFENGERVEADLFLGCDGGESNVRRQIFPHAAASRVRVREIVSVVESELLVARAGRRFQKIRYAKGGLALGMVPADPGTLIWFLQFDADRYSLRRADPAGLKNFVRSVTRDWAGPAQQLIAATDFRRSRVCETRYLQPLDAYFRQNVALLGDAAHALLSFTSQGVNTAIEDAVILAEALVAGGRSSLQQALSSYSETRKRAVLPLLEQGKLLQAEFLDPFHPTQSIPLASSG
jgi:2-polyprenyl-6-methoxyphenol hydroxylase-like FAD-dependent oxidoreductase